MHRTHLLLWLLAPLTLLMSATPALADRGVRDDAHFFKQDAVNDANKMIDQIYQRHHRDVMVETVAQVPDDQKQELEQQGKDSFFKTWAAQRFRDLHVNGILILICKNPAHLQLNVGNQTESHFLPREDQSDLSRQLLGDFRQKDFDQGLLTAVRFIGQRMDAHGAQNAGAARRSSGPYAPAPAPSYPARRHGGWGISSIACFLVAIVLGVILLGSIFGRRGGGTYYGGGGQYPPGNYPPGNYPPGGYPQGGYGYGGGGGGFGRGFLGGLLGGALGGYAAEKWTEHQNQGGGGYAPPPAGDAGANPDWSVPSDTSSNSMGGDFGSDSGGSSGGGGGDFGGGGGGDSGSSGGDF